MTDKISSLKFLQAKFEQRKSEKKSEAADKSMSMQGSFMLDKQLGRQNGASKATEVLNTVAKLADAMGVLNNSFDINASTTNPFSNTQQVSQNLTSGLATRVEGAQVYSSPATSYAADNIFVNLNSFDAPKLQETIDNYIKPMVQNTSSSLNAAKAEFNILAQQKEQAQASVENLQSQIETSASAKDEAKKTFDTNKSNLNSSIVARDKMDEQLSALNSEYQTVCEEVKDKETQKSQSQNNVSQCKSSVTTAEAELNFAAATYESAQSALDNTPEILENGLPNPAYTAAKTARDNALKAKENAEKNLDSAKQELEKAEQQLSTANENLNSAQDNKTQKLSQIKNSENECSKLAQVCEKNQQQVENAQQAYDTSLENYDNAENSFNKFNTELETSQGILTQYQEYDEKIKELQTAYDKSRAIQEKAMEALQAKDADMSADAVNDAQALQNENIKKEILENAGKSEGCSALKTPAENLLSMQNGPHGIKDRGEWVKTGMGSVETNRSFGVSIHNDVITTDGSYFEEIGCISNADGSFTNPENGETYVNVKENIWVNTMSFARMDAKYANEVAPEIRMAGIRASEQGKTWDIIKLDKNTGRAVLK